MAQQLSLQTKRFVLLSITGIIFLSLAFLLLRQPTTHFPGFSFPWCSLLVIQMFIVGAGCVSRFITKRPMLESTATIKQHLTVASLMSASNFFLIVLSSSFLFTNPQSKVTPSFFHALRLPAVYLVSHHIMSRKYIPGETFSIVFLSIALFLIGITDDFPWPILQKKTEQDVAGSYIEFTLYGGLSLVSLVLDSFSWNAVERLLLEQGASVTEFLINVGGICSAFSLTGALLSGELFTAVDALFFKSGESLSGLSFLTGFMCILLISVGLACLVGVAKHNGIILAFYCVVCAPLITAVFVLFNHIFSSSIEKISIWKILGYIFFVISLVAIREAEKKRLQTTGYIGPIDQVQGAFDVADRGQYAPVNKHLDQDDIELDDFSNDQDYPDLEIGSAALENNDELGMVVLHSPDGDYLINPEDEDDLSFI